MDEEPKYTLLVFDEIGENELFSISDIAIEEEYQKKLLEELGKCNVSRPLFHVRSKEWFYPAGTIKLTRDYDKVFFCQDGRIIFEVASHEIELKLYSQNPPHQNPKFIYQYNAAPAVYIKLYEPARKRIRPIVTTFGSWKTHFGAEHCNQLFWHRKMDDGTVKKVPITLFKKGMVNDNEYAYTEDERGNLVALSIESFMYFSNEKLFLTHERYIASESDRLTNFKELFDSFNHELSLNGKKCVKSLAADILAKYAAWAAAGSLIVAPVAFLVQHSGAGKSRMSVELLQELPGFYCLLKENGAYPRKNALFSELKSAFYDYFPSLMRDVLNKEGSMPARTLMVFAKMITIYLRQWHAYIMEAIADNPNNESPEVLAKQAFAIIGKRFYKNELIDCSFLNDSEFDQFILKAISGSTNKGEFNAAQAAKFIKLILDNPSKAFSTVFDEDEVGFDAMKSILAKTPFVIVLDEADYFDVKMDDFYTASFPITKFENLRRCLSYLEPQTKLFVLLPCKNAHDYFLQHPLCGNYGQNKHKTETLQPIILKSNSATFMNEYPLEEVVINRKVVTNPMFFKYLATLSSPVWASLDFGYSIHLAVQMLKDRPQRDSNVDPEPSQSCLLAIWMIRTGLYAHSFGSETAAELVKSHLATLSDGMKVSYPSDPMLAMASRSIMREYVRRIFFSALRIQSEKTYLLANVLTSAVGTMTCLIAIDAAPSCVRANNYVEERESLVSELCTIMPNLAPLWNKKKYVLQTVDADAHRMVRGLHTVTVRDFFESLLGAEALKSINGKLPAPILDGLINASHSVKAINRGECFSFVNLHFIPPRESKTIDDAMLQLGLALQCMFSVSGCGLGYDAVIPVILEDDSFTYLAVIFGSFGLTDIMFRDLGNSNLIILSIDLYSSEPFAKQIEAPGKTEEEVKELERVLFSQESPVKSEAIGSVSALIIITEPISPNNNVALISSLWSDGTRIFCIATHGLNCFPYVFDHEFIVDDIKKILQRK